MEFKKDVRSEKKSFDGNFLLRAFLAKSFGYSKVFSKLSRKSMFTLSFSKVMPNCLKNFDIQKVFNVFCTKFFSSEKKT